MWEKVGFVVSHTNVDFPEYSRILGHKEDFVWDATAINGPYRQPLQCMRICYMPGEFHNVAFYDDPHFTEGFNSILETIDPVERDAKANFFPHVFSEITNVLIYSGPSAQHSNRTAFGVASIYKKLPCLFRVIVIYLSS
ncbi:hypothetical protein ES703_73949 [subsurface metagenome]